MKRIFVLTLVLFLILIADRAISQTVFWYESFGTGCNQGAIAAGAAPTATNGAWTVFLDPSGPGNGGQANQWFISGTEAGMGPGNCGNGCVSNPALNNRSLHIGLDLSPPLLDPNATYTITPTSNTHRRAYTNTISCVGKNNVVLSFNYLGNETNTDYCTVEYFDGSTWSTLGTLAPSMGSCTPLGIWTPTSFPLPASANGNPGIRVGFKWRNNSGASGGGVSVAIDDVILAAPSVSFSMPSQICVGVPFSAVITQTADPTTSYSWAAVPGSLTFNPATHPANVTTTSITANTTGTITVILYAMNGANITASTTATVAVVNNITFSTAAAPSTICPGDQTNLSASGGVSYTWNPGNLSGTPVTVSPTVATVYTVQGSDANGCPGTGTLLVNMGQGPVLNIISTASAVCPGYNATICVSGAASYTWTGTGFPIPSNATCVVVGPGSYNLCASQPGFPCNTCTNIVITQAQPLNIVVTTAPQQATTCITKNFPTQSKPVQLYASGGSTYSWQPASSLNFSVGPNVLASPVTSTCYTVWAQTSVCNGSAVVCVTVIPQFTMDVIPKQPILCVGDTMKLTVSNIGTLGVAPFNYFWYEPQNAPPPSINNPLSGTVMISPTNTNGTVSYSVETIDARGCASIPRLVNATVLPQPETTIAYPIVNGVPVNTVCYVGAKPGSDPEALIKLEATTVGNPVGDYTYTWVPGYLPPYNAFPYVSIVESANSSTVLIAAPVRTPAVVVYTLHSGYNGIGYYGATCKTVDTVSIRVIDCRGLTKVSYTTATSNDTICTRNCVTFVNFTDTMAGGPITYEWIFPNGAPGTSTLTNPTICYNLPGNFNVILRASSPYPKPGGSTAVGAIQKFIKVVDIPNTQIVEPVSVNNPKNVVIRFGQQAVLTATNASYYEWRQPYNISSTTGSQVIVAPQRTAEYIVRGCNSSQCCFEDTMLVMVIEDCGEMFVPTAFSPNNDGHNDVLKVRGLCLESMTFMIFNRWGEKVFETADQNVGWDGTYKGEPMNTGVFVFRLEGKTWEGKAYSLKGNVTLIR